MFDYYKDLVTEIKLDAVRRHGSTRVGHGRPFGLFVNIRHTRDIERRDRRVRPLPAEPEQHGVLLQLRPTDGRLPRPVRGGRPQALKEHFEVISVTFQDEKVHSRATDEFGWRFTPYAYILLKPRGPQVDKIPPLRLDLDFLDTSGYVVLPVESPAVPIDARDSTGDPRPIEKLTVTQTLDERQADKGVLILEVKATGVGLIPELNDLCTVAPPGFEVAKSEDQGLAVKKFEEDADKNGIVSERTWELTLKAQAGQAELPKTFQFASVKTPAKEVIYQRDNDADLATVGHEVSLEKTYGTPRSRRAWLLMAGVAVLIISVAGRVPHRAAAENRRRPRKDCPSVSTHSSLRHCFERSASGRT